MEGLKTLPTQALGLLFFLLPLGTVGGMSRVGQFVWQWVLRMIHALQFSNMQPVALGLEDIPVSEPCVA